MQEDPPILKSESGEPKRRLKPGLPVDRLVLIAGIFIVFLGWVDIFVGWFPLGFGSPEWEFGVVSATVDGLPLSTVGLVMTLVGASSSGSRSGLGFAAIWAAWVLAVLVLGSVLYALTVPVALGVLGPEGLQLPLGRAVVKTSALIVIYLVLYGWMELQAIRHLWGRSSET